jgi:hypothetical protein
MLDFIIGCKLENKYLIMFKNQGHKNIIFNYYHGELQMVKKLKSYRQVVDTYFQYIQNGFIEMTSQELTEFYPDEFNPNTTITNIRGIEVEQTTRCTMQ